MSRHLIDGVPFGRPFLRIANRPPIHIPPRKRARLTYEQEGEDGSNDEVVISNQLVLHCSEDAEDTDESSEDGEYEGLDDELENELQYLVEDMEPAVEQQDAEPRITRSRKRRRGQGLGIEGSGMSTILSNDDSYFTNSQQVSFTQEAHINVPGLLCPAPAGGQRLKSRKEALHSQAPGRKRKVISRGSSRSSNKSVHFDGPELETPATIRMDRASQDSEDSGDENFKPASDLGSDNSEANKENVEPGPKKPKGKRANIKPMANPTVRYY